MSGLCKIKQEYILPEQAREVQLAFVSDKDKNKINPNDDNTNKSDVSEVVEPINKKQRTEEKKLKGQNKNRGKTFQVNNEKEVCVELLRINEGDEAKPCSRGDKCRYLHDVEEYLKNKPTDIGSVCYNYETFGKCRASVRCRFGTSHITSDGKNKINKEKLIEDIAPDSVLSTLQINLRKKKYEFKLAEKLIHYNDKKEKAIKENQTCGAITDEDLIKLLQREKKTINWHDKLFLSPLTTVGNLPFRRICKEFGVDVTCGEMVMCASLLQGKGPEWALTKRHSSEKIFGVQLCASNPYLFTKCGEILENEIDVDFIDINLGCPIDMVFNQGGGCGLLRRAKVLESCIKNLNQIISVPLTVKTRMAIYTNNNIAHTYVPKFRDWGVSLVTVHGRSREQRYTRNANWEYIRECAQAAAPMPVLGNGDILTYEDYKRARETSPELAGVMIGRGALIKPWIYTEIKEQKLWDISSSERFDILKKYTNYGLEHWGSDMRGVETTRRFLLEWLSFLYRYVPVGLLEEPPQKINERPPYYKGRDDLETLFASPSATDWIKISEMLLGPVPEGFHFLPKHKANSYK